MRVEDTGLKKGLLFVKQTAMGLIERMGKKTEHMEI